jgi:hypothetical protein
LTEETDAKPDDSVNHILSKLQIRENEIGPGHSMNILPSKVLTVEELVK